MSRLHRIVMVRHGETEGNSSVRFHGAADVPLSDEGRAQMRETARGIGYRGWDAVVASPLQRAWESAQIVARGAPVRLDGDFREVDFGRWEGMNLQEIEASDPILFRDWQDKKPGFEFPAGEPRADFVKRIHRGLDRLLESGATNALVVAHKGPIRTIAEKLTGEPPAQPSPELAGVVTVSCDAAGNWFLGTRGSNPEGVG